MTGLPKPAHAHQLPQNQLAAFLAVGRERLGLQVAQLDLTGGHLCGNCSLVGQDIQGGQPNPGKPGRFLAVVRQAHRATIHQLKAE